MAFRNNFQPGEQVLAADVNSMADAIIQSEHNIFELALENYFANKVTPINGMFFDGFSDAVKADQNGGNITAPASSGQPNVTVSSIAGLSPNTEIDIFDESNGNLETKIIQSVLSGFSADIEKDSGQFFSAGDSVSLSVTGDMTIECWVKFETLPSLNARAALVSKWDDAAGFNSFVFNLRNDGGGFKLNFLIAKDGINATQADISHTPATGVWNHYALKYTSGGSPQIEVVKDGVSLGTATFTNSSFANSIHDNTSTLRIGAYASPAGNFLDAKIDDVRIWSALRSNTDIANNRSLELTGSELNLKAYWKLNNSLVDSTPNGNTLTNNGGILFTIDTPFGQSSITFTTNLANSYTIRWTALSRQLKSVFQMENARG